MERLNFNLKNYFKYQNKFFFDKLYYFFNTRKAKEDELFFEEKQNGEGFIRLRKNGLNYTFLVFCNQNHEWKIVFLINDDIIREMNFHYDDENYDIIQIQKEMVGCL